MRDLLKQTIPNLTDEACDKFVAYYDLLIDWNARMNLTAITEPNEVVKKHFYDSLAALPYLSDGAKAADVGTGAGFPAIPLLIMNPTLRVTLVDSLQKRLTFLEEVSRRVRRDGLPRGGFVAGASGTHRAASQSRRQGVLL